MNNQQPFHTNTHTAPRTPLRRGRGESVRLVDDELGNSRNVDVHLNLLAPGSGPGPRHFHEKAENVYLVLDGVIEVEVDGTVTELRRDDVMFIPPGVIHATRNPGSDTAAFIEIYAPAGRDFHIVDEPGEA